LLFGRKHCANKSDRTILSYLLVAFKTTCPVHTGVNTVEINTEAAGSDITEYHPPDDKPSASMFGFLFVVIYCAIFHSLISLCLTCLMFV